MAPRETTAPRPNSSLPLASSSPTNRSNKPDSASTPAPPSAGQEAPAQGYPGQITGSKKSNRIDPGDDEDDSLPEDEPLDLGPLSPRSLYALRNLARYGRRQRHNTLKESAVSKTGSNASFDVDYPDWPKQRRAGVMVALFGGRTGELNVVLSTRALDLRVNVSFLI
jgi:hypothetical protein